MYMEPFRCKVVGHTGSRAVGPAVPPVWCEDDPNHCVKGPKQVKSPILVALVKRIASRPENILRDLVFYFCPGCQTCMSRSRCEVPCTLPTTRSGLDGQRFFSGADVYNQASEQIETEAVEGCMWHVSNSLILCRFQWVPPDLARLAFPGPVGCRVWGVHSVAMA